MRTYGVSFDEDDIAKVISASKPRGAAITELALTGEALVLAHVHSQSGISNETYRARMAELKAQRRAAV